MWADRHDTESSHLYSAKGMGWLDELGQFFERDQDWDKLRLIHPLRPIP